MVYRMDYLRLLVGDVPYQNDVRWKTVDMLAKNFMLHKNPEEIALGKSKSEGHCLQVFTTEDSTFGQFLRTGMLYVHPMNTRDRDTTQTLEKISTTMIQPFKLLAIQPIIQGPALRVASSKTLSA